MPTSKINSQEKYEDARFLFERNIVFNPKDATSYLYLAKIYNHEENQRKEEFNLETALLIEPDNEEAILMMMKIAIEKSNYDEVKNLSDTCLLYTSPSPRDLSTSRMPSSA